MARKIGFISGIVLCALLSWFELWFAGVMDGATHRASRGDLVDSYAEALAEGKASLQTPTAKLAKLPLAQQPSTRPEDRILDASYFNGEYYLYYGIVPFAILAPWRAVMGSFLAAEMYIAGMVVVGNVMLLLGFFRLVTRVDGWRGSWAASIAFLIAATNSGALSLLGLPEIHQVECATACCLNAVIFFALARATTKEAPSLYNLGLAVAAAALLIGCRPNQFFTVFAVGVWAIYQVWCTEGSHKQKLRELAVISLAPVLVAIVLGALNFARFGDVFEFGMKYGTGTLGRPEIASFRAGNLLYNLHAYLIGGIQTQPYFPFIGGPLHPDRQILPPGHEGLDQVYGWVGLFPALLLLPLAWHLRRWSALLLVAGLGIFIYLCGLGFGTFRYMADFGVLFAICAGMGAIAIAIAAKGLWIGPAFAAISLLAAYGTASAICLTTSIACVHGGFQQRRAADFARVGRVFNQPVYLWQSHFGPHPRLLAFDVQLPNRAGAVEPFLVTGWLGLQDFIYFVYTTPSTFQIGFESIGRGGPVSDLIPIDYSRAHRIEFMLGNRLPPADHPVFYDAIPSEVRALYDQFEVYIDGNLVVKKTVKPHEWSGYDYVGQSPFDKAFGAAFTGTIVPADGTSLNEYLKRRKSLAR